MIRAIRGATTAQNTKDSIIENTKELLEEILKVNELDIDQIISVLFTATADLDAAYPAVAAREMGMVDAALMCVREMHVDGSLPRCIRVQVTAEMDISQKDVKHVYLKEAWALRPDLIDR
jgi:monofunctional chorismate mutase